MIQKGTDTVKLHSRGISVSTVLAPDCLFTQCFNQGSPMYMAVPTLPIHSVEHSALALNMRMHIALAEQAVLTQSPSSAMCQYLQSEAPSLIIAPLSLLPIH